MNSEARRAVLEALLDCSASSDFTLLAAHVRESHVHVIVSHTSQPASVCGRLKVAATRRLRALGLVPSDRPIWADYRNIRRLPTR